MTRAGSEVEPARVRLTSSAVDRYFIRSIDEPKL